MQEKSLIKKNILKYLDYKGITKYNFYQTTGITRGILDQNNGMSEENTTRFLVCFPEVSAYWLILDIGPMIRDGFVEEKKEEKEEIPVKVIDNSSMGFILDRYEGLVAENAILKQEVEQLKQSRGKDSDVASYPDYSPKIGTHMATEPRHK